ncbi:MAG: hypothetical protein DMF66_19460 [Acidobacteria bacterium]|nr:MAG: hypothetical protein DMF66_19460 [Acidobacteriota bacterium]
MFLLFAEKAAEASEQAPAIVQFVNHYVGEPVFNFEMKYTYPFWQKFFGYFGTTPEKVFGEYTPENAVPWYTVMFIIAVALTFVVVWVLKPRRLSVEEPTYTQLVLEKGMLAIRDLLADNVGPHGVRYFPVVATFGILILISNLMGLIPGLMAPTSATSVTFALGITSFVYYNAIGIRENGLLGHLGHFAGPILWLAPLLFVVELISNFVRPISLGLRRREDSGDDRRPGAEGAVAARPGHAAQPLRGVHADVHLRAALDHLHQRGLARAARGGAPRRRGAPEPRRGGRRLHAAGARVKVFDLERAGERRGQDAPAHVAAQV